MTMPDTFSNMLANAWQRNNSLLCVGLDPDPQKIPRHLRTQDDALLKFCTAIVDATADLVCSFKPQIAYFSAHRAEAQLEALIQHIHTRHPGIPVILDAKRGDIGNTAEQYAIEAFERYQADALTINPYMGHDSIAPYLAYPNKGTILLCRTSNPGSQDLQTRRLSESPNGEALYEYIAQLADKYWNPHGQCALVVGATYPSEIARVRAITGDMPLLVPGIGAQGGDIAATVHAGCDSRKQGLIINSSRAILYAGTGEDFALRARHIADETRKTINQYRTSSPAI